MKDDNKGSGLAESAAVYGLPGAANHQGEPTARQPVGTSNSVDVKKGESDPLGDQVTRIHICTDEFFIYSIECGLDEIRRPRYFLRGNYKAAEEYRQRLNVINGALNRINDLIVGMRPDTFTFPFYRRHYRSLVERAREHQAQAMQQAFEGHGPDALLILSEFRDEIENCRDSRNKMRYIFANALSVIILLALWWHFRSSGESAGTVALLMNSPQGLGAAPGASTVRLVDLLALGAIGAFFSVSIGINALKINNAITIPEMLYAGFVRVLIGLIGAGVVFLLIFGGWILTAVSEDYRVWTYALFAFIGGFSEFFVPNALKRAEETVVVKAPATPAATAGQGNESGGSASPAPKP